jgi:signal transduction histidine kinase
MTRAFGIAIAAGVLVTFLLASGVTEMLDLPARDVVLRMLPERAARHAIVVALDERSLRSVEPWPWRRERIAELLDRCAGARAIVVDVLLTDERDGDARLAASMARVPVIAVSVLGDRGEWLLPAPLLRHAATPAHGSFEVDHDGILRRFASTKQNGERALTAVSVETASLISGAPVPIGVSIAPAFRTPARTIPLVSAVDVLRNRATAGRLRGKLVFIGPTALALGDRVLTPTSAAHRPDVGVTVHAAATESLLRGDVIRTAAPLVSGAVAAVAIFIVLHFGTTRVRRISIAIAAIVLLTASSVALLDRNLALPYVTLVLGIAIAAAIAETVAVTATLRRGHAAVTRLESGLGIVPAPQLDDVGPRIETLAERLAEHREREADAKRLLAHELRTPLASMRGLTQLIGGFELSDAERQRVASLLELEAGKLQTMVQALLDLEKLPLRDFDASANVLDIGELAGARVEFLRASTDRALHFSSERALRVRGDAALIERIVDNLVGNALKYTPQEAAVTIRVRRAAGDAVLEVDDRGPGIAPAERAKIFERFARGSTAAGTQGLGLGLSLVAEIARWHRGGVTLDDAEGGGARFRVTLPLAGGS